MNLHCDVGHVFFVSTCQGRQLRGAHSYIVIERCQGVVQSRMMVMERSKQVHDPGFETEYE
jgi:hypothetical protein